MGSDQFPIEGPIAAGALVTNVQAPIANEATSDGDALIYRSADGKWHPEAVSGGGVTSVTAALPLLSSGGTTPQISITGTGIPNASLTNSSLTVIAGAGLSGGGTVALGASTSLAIDSTVATLTGSQALTNKTISGSSNTLSNIGNGSLTNSAVTVTAGAGLSGGGAVSLGASTSLSVATAITTKYTTPGTSTWTVNANTKRIFVKMFGGGGGGGSGRQGTVALTSGGSGGGGGGGSEAWFTLADISSPQTIIVGSGGIGGTSQASPANDGRVGNPGTVSSFGTLLRAAPGLGGNAGSNITVAGVSGGAGIFVGGTSSSAPINANGTNNSALASAAYSAGGGGGGGPIAASFGNGGAGTYPASFFTVGTTIVSTVGAQGNLGTSSTLMGGSLGGGGGASGDATGTVAGGTGGNGGAPGGGAGGGGGSVSGAASGAGGDGGNGAVWITEYFT